MPQKTKITLSDKELSLVKDAEWILTKQTIIQKVYDLFAARIEIIAKEVLATDALPSHVRSSVPKIYRGENYLQLPYVILDYPRCFEKEDIFAVRTMFWWGNFFSITLHLSGLYKEYARENLYRYLQVPIDDLFIGVNENQWQHHFEADNFVPYDQFTRAQRIALFEQNNFVKLAVKFSLDDWNEMPALLDAGYKKISRILFNSPTGETGL